MNDRTWSALKKLGSTGTYEFLSHQITCPRNQDFLWRSEINIYNHQNTHSINQNIILKFGNIHKACGRALFGIQFADAFIIYFTISEQSPKHHHSIINFQTFFIQHHLTEQKAIMRQFMDSQFGIEFTDVLWSHSLSCLKKIINLPPSDKGSWIHRRSTLAIDGNSGYD